MSLSYMSTARQVWARVQVFGTCTGVSDNYNKTKYPCLHWAMFRGPTFLLISFSVCDLHLVIHLIIFLQLVSCSFFCSAVMISSVMGFLCDLFKN